MVILGWYWVPLTVYIHKRQRVHFVYVNVDTLASLPPFVSPLIQLTYFNLSSSVIPINSRIRFLNASHPESSLYTTTSTVPLFLHPMLPLLFLRFCVLEIFDTSAQLYMICYKKRTSQDFSREVLFEIIHYSALKPLSFRFYYCTVGVFQSTKL